MTNTQSTDMARKMTLVEPESETARLEKLEEALAACQARLDIITRERVLDWADTVAVATQWRTGLEELEELEEAIAAYRAAYQRRQQKFMLYMAIGAFVLSFAFVLAALAA
jgi:vacuolar-type H+-ATPase subunit C/Vma6